MTEPLEATAGRRGWIISDGKIGNDVQARGVFDALRLDYEIKHVFPTGIWQALSPWGPVDPAERFGAPQSRFCPPWPDFAMSIGRLTTPYIRRLKQLTGLATYTVILQDPRVGAKTADLFWVPEHDMRRGPNVITTLTAPHSFTRERLRQLRAHLPSDIAALPKPRVAVLLGGPNGYFNYTKPVLARLAAALGRLAAQGAGLMVTPSRRTPREVLGFVRDATAGTRRLLWDGSGDNPYPAFLAHADAFIVPADSATGKPVYVFTPAGGSTKFARFHATLHRYGATRPLPDPFERLESWNYVPLSSSDAIAAEIARRWLKRRRMLGAPPPAHASEA
jgi:mitochondrial fission protein ELM1